MSQKKGFLKRSLDVIRGGFNYNFESKGTSPEFRDVMKRNQVLFDKDEMDKFFSDNYVSKEDHEKALEELMNIKSELTNINGLLKDNGNFEELKEELKVNQSLHSIEIMDDIKNTREEIEAKIELIEQKIISSGKESKDDIKSYIEQEIVNKSMKMKNSLDAMFWVVVVNSVILLTALYFIFTKI